MKALPALVCVSALLASGCGLGTHIDDSVVTTRVKLALLAAPEVTSLDIKVQTRGGAVQLSGFVDGHNPRERAVQVTRAVAGVKTVVVLKREGEAELDGFVYSRRQVERPNRAARGAPGVVSVSNEMGTRK